MIDHLCDLFPDSREVSCHVNAEQQTSTSPPLGEHKVPRPDLPTYKMDEVAKHSTL